MNPTPSTTSAGGGVPADRYGRPATGRRPLAYAAAALLAVLAVAWVAWVALGGSDPVSAQVQGFEEVAPRVVRARVVVTAPPDAAVRCTLRALDEDRAVVGRAALELPAGARSRGASVDIRVLTSASSVEEVGCSPA
ncbi:uncharacterized protein DUF4307 [Motilibacter peucedani]|uniref:Uncharacterized protein DUF4307 n=1 Tax=Motilibacter peucedani TaxID=598650 RepID=A0A420XV41_9ACTN|nr:DUF4307 domain-containing protein [Motilibacter peucedani]RKS80704.1 uncharacterized protein DUF4307 [Motilibacter peucedani]